MTNEYRFLNPYNFVRYLPETTRVSETGDQILLGRCSPPPHDRYLALSGRIECKIESITPLFVSDSEGIQDGVNKCKSYQFFKVDDGIGEDLFAIPATSLKGVIRNVFEAATNSCFSVLEGGKLGKRERPEKYSGEPIPGLILSLPTETRPGKIQRMISYDLPHRQFGKFRNKYRMNGKQIDVEINEHTRTVTRVGGSIKGYLKTSDKGIGRKGKQKEFVFISPKNPDVIDLPYKVYWDYVIANKNNKQDHTKEPKVGDTIWFRLDEKQDIRVFGYTKIHRKPFKASIDDLLPSYLQQCSDYMNLCPACRVFGWVHPNPSQDLDVRSAYAGRASISNARLMGKPELFVGNPITLAILAAPKPTTERFYLLNNDGKPNSKAKYNKGYKLRGRKFYRHHAMMNIKNKEYSRPEMMQDKHNRILRDVLAPGSCFSFSIDFHNLASLELGALLWSIQLEKGMYHKIGLGKPLGFGSVKISIISMKIIDTKQRYSSFAEKGWKEINEEQRSGLITQYMNAIAKRYGANDFSDLLNIQDLHAILSRNDDDFPIHYPRMNEQADPDGKNYEWFESNKNQSLGLASADNGLYLSKNIQQSRNQYKKGGGTKRGGTQRSDPTTPRDEYFQAIKEFIDKTRESDRNLPKLLRFMRNKRLEPELGFKKLGFQKFKEAVLAAIEEYQLNCIIDTNQNIVRKR